MHLKNKNRVIAIVLIIMIINTLGFSNFLGISEVPHVYAEAAAEGSGYAYFDNVSIYSEDVNLVRNSDFEICKVTTESAIFGWEKDLDADSGNSGVTIIDKGSGCGGTNSIRIGPKEGGRGQIINNIPENTSFILSGWGKVSTTGATVYFGVDCLDIAGKRIPGGKFGLEFSADKYSNLTKTFTTKPGTAMLQVYVYKNAPGTENEYGYIDNISLIQTSSSPIVDKPLKNMDFEIFDEKVPADIDGWNNWGNTVIVNGEGCDGKHAAKIGTDEGGAGQLVDNITAGSIYKVTGWGKTSIQGTADAAIIGVDCFDKDDAKIAGGKISIEFTETEYVMKSFTFKAPEGTKKIQLYIYKNPGKGFAYLDNITFTKLEPEADTMITPSKPADGVLFDDFTNGIDPAKWLIGKAQWGGADANGGVIPKNVDVKNGVVEITGHGNLYNGPVKGINNDGSLRDNGKRTGGVIVTKDYYGSGSYEVRAKIIPQLGVCSAFWTYFNDGAKNHEIDIEMPGNKTINQMMATTWVTEATNTSEIVDTPKVLDTEKGINDGEWHTYRFDWHTDPANPRVEYYLDGKHVYTSSTNIPFAAGRFWSGLWFPRNWAGVPDFDTDKMFIDWIRITPFNESGDQWLKNYDGSWADLSEYPPMQSSSYVKPVNTHNITYLSIDEMNGKRALTDESIRDFVKQLEQYSIEYQFCDMGTFDGSGKLSAPDAAMVKQWMSVSRAACPGQKIIATVNGELSAHVRGGEAMRQAIADECKKLVDRDGFNFDGIQVDMEPFRADGNADLVDLLKKIRASIGSVKHLSIATTTGQKNLPDSDITAIAAVVDMINPMMYDSNGPGEGDVKTADEYVGFWKNTVLRFSNAIAKSGNQGCQLNPTMPVYQKKGYAAAPGWPDADSNMVVYHLPGIENIHNAVQGLKQAINAGAKVYGSGIFWWGCFTSVQYDGRDGQDYAKDRKWWLEEWVNAKMTPSDPGDSGNNGNNQSASQNPVNGKDVVITREGNAPKAQLETVLYNGRATSAVDAALFDRLNKQAEKDNNGIRKFVLDVQKNENAKSYSVRFDGVNLNAEKAATGIEIRTQLATCVIPDNMLSSMKSTAKSVELNIGAADKSKLSEAMRKTIGDKPVIELGLLLDGKAARWENPDAPVKVTLKYSPSAEELKDPEHITVWYIGDDGKAIPVSNGRFNPATGTVTFSVTHFSQYAVVNVVKTFNDLEKHGWAKKQIEILASKGIMTGTSDESFSPDAAVNRAEFVELLVKTLGLSASFSGNFNDIRTGTDSYEAVGAAKKLGIVTGVGNNNLNPSAEISRQDMMVMTYRALAVCGKGIKAGAADKLGAYADVPEISGYAAEGVSALVNNGLVQGKGKYIVPKGRFTRAEAAVLLYKLYSMLAG